MKLITASQSRAARGLLNWSQPDLAERCGMHVQTISSFEQEVGSPTKRTLQKIAQTFELAGIDFSEGDDGVRRIHNTIQKYEGIEGFRRFMDEVYHVANTEGGDICLYNAKPENWIKWLGVEWNSMHSARMKEIAHKFKFRITVKEGETQFLGKHHAEYRWFPKELWDERSFYVYGDSIGFLNFETENVEVFVLKQKRFADSFRALFNIAWNNVSIIPKI